MTCSIDTGHFEPMEVAAINPTGHQYRHANLVWWILCIYMNTRNENKWNKSHLVMDKSEIWKHFSYNRYKGATLLSTGVRWNRARRLSNRVCGFSFVQLIVNWVSSNVITLYNGGYIECTKFIASSRIHKDEQKKLKRRGNQIGITLGVEHKQSWLVESLVWL